MGIKKSIEINNTGVSGEHSVIKKITQTKKGEFVLSVETYKDKLAKQDGKDPLLTKNYIIKNLDDLSTYLISALYVEVGKLEDFKDGLEE